MAIGLPEVPNADGIRKSRVVAFGGYNHTLGAGDGELWDMKNLTGDHYPVLSTRKPRYRQRTLTKPNGLYAHDGLCWVDGTGFYADGVRKGTVTDNRKSFASLGDTIIILPDKKYYNRNSQTFGNLEASWTGSMTIGDGTYAGEAAEANTITASAGWATWFRVGDAVTVSGTKWAETPVIIREIEGGKLRFYENTFEGETGTGTRTVKRAMPDLSFICENENRLWGCKGDTIYASKLGDPFNWNVFDGLSTDSYAADVGSAGDFTGCASLLGYPVFFKEEHIYKVYGDRPANFQLMGSADLGIEAGSERSPAIAGETMFYLSRAGVVAYSGGIPQSIAAPFGTDRYRNAVGGSDGLKYYVSMQDTAGAWSIFVYDTRSGLWHREDEREALDWAWNGELYMLDASGGLWLSGSARTPTGTEESPLESMAEFADFTSYSRDYAHTGSNKKGTSKLQLRIELDEGATVTVAMQFDSDGVWREVRTLTATVKRSFYLPIIPRRSDHFRIRLTGTGQWRLWSLIHESYSGSELFSH